MNRCIIIGAMSHDSGEEMTKLLTTMTGIQKKIRAEPARVLP
jgi:hypothetical protein